MNFRREFSAIQYSVLGGEEKRLSVANDPTALITFQALYVRTTRSRPLHDLTTLAPSIIVVVVNDPCLFLVILIRQSLTCFLCAMHLAMGGTLLLLRWQLSTVELPQ